MANTKKAATKAAKKSTSVSNAIAPLHEAKITVAEAQKLLKANVKTVASVPGRAKVMVVNKGGSLSVVKRHKKTFKRVTTTTDLKEAVAAYNKAK